MSWIDPEKIMTGLMKSMGVSPQDFVSFIQTVQREINEMRADRLAFKPASIKAYQELTARLNTIEAKIDVIMLGLSMGAEFKKPLNGDDIHERSSDLGHG